MKTISVAMQAHLAGEVTTLATLWKITLLNGTVKTFTDHDRDVVYLGLTYTSTAGFAPSNVQTSAAMDVNNMEVRGFLLTPYVDKDQLLSGAWDHAAVEIVTVNYNDLTMGAVTGPKGRLGETKQGRQMFTAELRGMSQQLQRSIGELTSASCRYDLGDTRCGKSLTDYTVTGAAVVTTSTQYSFISNLTSSTVRLTPSSTGAPTTDYFQGGKLTWLTGLNAGVVLEVENYNASTGLLTLTAGMYYTIAAADTFTVIAGCNKLLKTADGVYNGDCKVRFGNVVNFGGEPEISGEKTLNVGGQ